MEDVSNTSSIPQFAKETDFGQKDLFDEKNSLLSPTKNLSYLDDQENITTLG